MHISPWNKLLFFGVPTYSEPEPGVDSRGEVPLPKVSDPPVGELVKVFASDPEKMSREFTCAQMAQMLGVSAYSLRNYFQLEIMQDFRSWKSDQRVTLAQRMLIDQPETPISDIGLMLGFRDKSNFFRCFRARTGMTPSQWRRKTLELD